MRLVYLDTSLQGLLYGPMITAVDKNLASMWLYNSYVHHWMLLLNQTFMFFPPLAQFNFTISQEAGVSIGPFNFKSRVTPDAGPTFVLNSGTTYDIIMQVIFQ